MKAYLHKDKCEILHFHLSGRKNTLNGLDTTWESTVEKVTEILKC